MTLQRGFIRYENQDLHCVIPKARLAQSGFQCLQRRLTLISTAGVARNRAKQGLDAVRVRAEVGCDYSVALDGEVPKSHYCGSPVDVLPRQPVDEGLAAFDEAVDLVIHAAGRVDDEDQVCARLRRVSANLHTHDFCLAWRSQ